MGPLDCPHCGVLVNEDDLAAFCEACGKALPDPLAAGPRILDKGELATTWAGQALQAAELDQEAKKAARTLLGLAVFSLIINSAMLFFMNLQAQRLGGHVQPAVHVLFHGTSVGFFLLYLSARRNPLPAAVVGLLLYVSLLGLYSLWYGPHMLISYWYVKVIVISGLLKAISAGRQHRKLLKELQALEPGDAEALPEDEFAATDERAAFWVT